MLSACLGGTVGLSDGGRSRVFELISQKIAKGTKNSGSEALRWLSFASGGFAAGTAITVRRARLRDFAGRFGFRFEDDTHPGMEHLRDPAEHAQRMPFITRRFEPADLLLRCLERGGELLLRQAGLFAQRGDLERDIPGLAGALETLREIGIAELLAEVAVKIGLFHRQTDFTEGNEDNEGRTTLTLSPALQLCSLRDLLCDSFVLSFEPVAHAGVGGFKVAGGNRSALVADSVDGDNAATAHEKPKYASVEFPEVAQFEQSFAQRLRERLAMVRTVAQSGQPRDNDCEIVGIAGFQIGEEFLNGTSTIFRFVELYRELHLRRHQI